VIQPDRVIARHAEETAFLAATLDRVARRRLADLDSRLRSLGDLMHSLSPDAVLKRGFSITTDEAGHPVTSAEQLRSGDRLRTRLADGEIVSRVE
jgi:exodeoxyribonuclease VII large subunit